ncbi:MAG: hypothetical protein QF815_03230 [Candidatus Peribacteraceae bacterium]|jgi:hypothetical protein|nr:hypothetical protein [Candidatus Peribacteraceae bacterium]
MPRLSHRIRTAETVIDPAAGASGIVLTLQVSDEVLNPTLIVLESGALVAVQADSKQILSSDKIVVSNFWVQNTSATEDTPSVYVTFYVSGTIPLPQPTPYDRKFETAINLFPDHATTSHCSCASPSCTNNVYSWFAKVAHVHLLVQH